MRHELTVWSRGIIMDKEARDVSTCIATAARGLGYHAENVTDYDPYAPDPVSVVRLP